MARDHVGALSGVTYTIHELTDRRDIEVAFETFADTIPKSPAVLDVATIAVSTVAVVNTLYLSTSATPITVTLPGTGADNDRICIAQLGAGVVTVSGIGAGVPVTAGANTAVSAVWDGTKWVGLPFSFSGTRPAESSGGTITDLNGFRYHVFTTPGTYTFISHAALTVDGYVIGGGSSGGVAGGSPGVAGGGGVVTVVSSQAIGDWSFTTVVVGAGGTAGGAGGQSSLAGTTAAGGAVAGANAAVTLTGDWATVIAATVGGPGAANAGPTAATVKGKGGGGGHLMLASYVQGTETYSYSTGGPYSYDCSYGARSETVQTGTQTVTGDAQPMYCPSGWGSPAWVGAVRCTQFGTGITANNGWQGGCPGGWYGCGANCCYDQPTYGTTYHCDSGGSLSGTTCVRTCNGDSTQWFTGTRPVACASGYTASGGMCVDSRGAGPGAGGPGIVALRYARP